MRYAGEKNLAVVPLVKEKSSGQRDSKQGSSLFRVKAFCAFDPSLEHYIACYNNDIHRIIGERTYRGFCIEESSSTIHTFQTVVALAGKCVWKTVPRGEGSMSGSGFLVAHTRGMRSCTLRQGTKRNKTKLQNERGHQLNN